jgi:TonB-linked SusC/RagA family outer membrane protein
MALPSFSLSAESSLNLKNPSVENLLEISSGMEQQKQITGKVSDEKGNPLVGVTVLVKGTTLGSLTDPSGKYIINNAPNASTLVFSFIGMTTQEIPAGNLSQIDVVLKETAIGLDEVVVVGYGTTRKITSTGSVTSVNGDNILQSPSTNISNNLVGRLPGLVAVTSSGEPGNDAAGILIRGVNTLGNNSPLIVVDGITNRGFERLDPADIESLTVLKDASAAIYGAQAANGVILVTTRRGKIGKPKITFNVSSGFNQPTRLPKMADADQFATMLNEVAYYRDPSSGRNQKFSNEEIKLFADGSDPWGHPNTDWFKTVLKPWAKQTYQNISISGGTENMKYFLSLGHKFEDAYYKHSATNFNQYDFRTNIDGKVSKNIDISFDLSGREEDRNYPVRDAATIWSMLIRSFPNMPAYYPDGSPAPDMEYGNQPVAITADGTGYNDSKYLKLESNLRANITIPWVKGLMVTTNASFDKDLNFSKNFNKPWYLYSWNGDAAHTLTQIKRGFDSPNLSESMNYGYQLTFNAYASYERSLSEKHNFKIMAGVEKQTGRNDDFSAYRQNYVSADIDELFAGATNQYMSNSGSADQFARMSYYGRVNYNYSQKYLLEFVWRYDGSYKFAKGKQFGFFPGVSAGWRISEENFWKNSISFINDFKIRGSWGQTGNDRIADYQYLTTYAFSNYRYVFGQSIENQLLVETKTPNPNVTWEVANQSNIGFDSYLFGSKLSVSAEYFYNKRSQILIQRNLSIPTTSGMTLPLENIGKVSNQGMEVVVGLHMQTGQFKYNISVNGSYSNNKIVFWDETPGVPDYQKSTGRPIGSDLYYQAIGIFKDQAAIDAYPHWAGAVPGDVIFKDVNNDGKIDGLDRVMNDKSGTPKFIGGMTLNLQFKQFDLSMLVQGAGGAVAYIRFWPGEYGNYYEEFFLKRWTPENTGASYPRAWSRDEGYWNQNQNTFWVRSSDYVRLKNLEIGYNMPSKVNKLLGIDGLRLYLNGSNLVTLDRIKLYDPESLTNYALQRVINAGLILTF